MRKHVAVVEKTESSVATDESRDDVVASLIKGERKKKRIRRIVAALLIAAAAAGVAFWQLGYGAEAGGQLGPRHVTETVTRGDLIAAISATGTVEALNTVEVGAEISGRILSLNADFNDTVSAGDVLAVIDPEQHKASVAQAKAQMLAARANVTEAEATLLENKQTLARSVALEAKGLVSKKELENAEAAKMRAEASLESARASAAIAKASLDSSKTALSKTTIVSPISGTVLSREVEVGQAINAGMSTPVLYVIAEDLRRMRLSSRVDEADIGQVVTGLSATFTVDAYPGKTFTSTVTSVRNVPETDDNVVSYEVILSVDNQDLLLKPGMTASVEIITQKHESVLLVSNKAFRFTPNRESSGMRGPPMPFFGRMGKGAKGEANAGPPNGLPSATEKPKKLSANQARLWIVDKNGPPGMPQGMQGMIRPVVVEKIATDGLKTAVASDELKEGDAVVVAQADSAEEAAP